MTEKQKRFADEYLIDLNATRAYKAVYRAAKSDESAAAAGGRLIKRKDIQDYIKEQSEKLHDDKTADVKEVMEYLTAVLRGESESEVVMTVGTGDGCSEIMKVKKNPDEKEKLKAAELIGKRYGMFTERTEISGGATIVFKEDLSE